MSDPHVGNYEVVRTLARGGMATVFLARQPALDRDVALKRLDLQTDDPTLAHRFVGEARLAAELDHPNIVTLFDFFEHDGVPYIAMEYVAGGSLRPFVGKLEVAQAIHVFEGVLGALAHAETHGIAHRDLKPENVLLTPGGRVKVTDFGIARAYSVLTSRLTRTGTAMGTPAYMAPEQALDEPLGAYTDLYSLGVMAYEQFSGRLPFGEGETPLAVLYRHVNQPVPSLQEAAPELPARLVEWVERLLAKAPSDRPASAVDAWEQLEELTVDLLGPFWRRHALPVAPAVAPETGDGFVTYGAAADAQDAPPPVESGDEAPPEPAPAGVPDEPAGFTRAPTLPPAPAVPAEPPAADAPSKTRRRLPVPMIALALPAIVAATAAAGFALRSKPPDKPPAMPPFKSAIGGEPFEVALGGGFVWASHLGTDQLSRVNLRDRSLATIKGVGRNPRDVTFGSGAAWVADRASGRVVRVEPSTRELQPIDLGGEVTDVAAGAGYVWVADRERGLISGLDPTRRQPGRSIKRRHLPSKPMVVAADDGAVWALLENTRLARMSIGSGGLLAAARTVRTGTVHPAGLAFTRDAAWIIDIGGQSVMRVPLRADGTRKKIALRARPGGIAVGGGFVWVTLSTTDQLVRIDPKTSTVTWTHLVGPSPQGLAFGDGLVWIASHDGGTVEAVEVPEVADPKRPSPTPSRRGSATPTVNPTSGASATGVPSPTEGPDPLDTPTFEPPTPSPTPTDAPTITPTITPTEEPTEKPWVEPTEPSDLCDRRPRNCD